MTPVLVTTLTCQVQASLEGGLLPESPRPSLLVDRGLTDYFVTLGTRSLCWLGLTCRQRDTQEQLPPKGGTVIFCSVIIRAERLLQKLSTQACNVFRPKEELHRQSWLCEGFLFW